MEMVSRTHGTWLTVPLNDGNGTASLRRRYKDGSLDVVLSTAPGVTFRVKSFREQYDSGYSVTVVGGDLDGERLVPLRAFAKLDGALSWRVDGSFREKDYPTVQDAIAAIWPSYEARMRVDGGMAA